MRAPVHLLPVNDALDEKMCRYRAYLALCGALVSASGLPAMDLPPGCDCGVYCPECVRVAAAVAGQGDPAGAAR